MKTPALLALEDGSIFLGISIGAEGERCGEVVFNTSMTGYQEILSDPSYEGQMVTLTYPHIGNVGTNSEDQESTRAFASGLIIRDLSLIASNYRNQMDLPTYLKQNNVVGIAEIDTRALTHLLRDKGAQRGCIIAGHRALESDAGQYAVRLAQASPSMNGLDLASVVSTKTSYPWSEGWASLGEAKTIPKPRHKVVVIDYGVKYNILRCLVEAGCEVLVVPSSMTFEEILQHKPHGVLLANGPGDPAACHHAIATIKKLLQTNIPIFGICLGHQLLALAYGAKTYKMKFGHHGGNHPVVDVKSGRVFITSQNHGFAVDEATLPSNLVVTHRSLFDNSNQGLAHTEKAVFSFQGHPEASPGPHDIQSLFNQFVVMMDREHSTTKSAHVAMT